MAIVRGKWIIPDYDENLTMVYADARRMAKEKKSHAYKCYGEREPGQRGKLRPEKILIGDVGDIPKKYIETAEVL
jgi:hypothetical protein